MFATLHLLAIVRALGALTLVSKEKVPDVIFMPSGIVVKWRKNRVRIYMMFLYSLEPDLWPTGLELL